MLLAVMKAEPDIVRWMPDGRSFEICDVKLFESRVLASKKFGYSCNTHRNWSRNLRNFGFKACADRNKNVRVHFHEHFQRDRPDLAQLIFRRLPIKKRGFAFAGDVKKDGVVQPSCVVDAVDADRSKKSRTVFLEHAEKFTSLEHAATLTQLRHAAKLGHPARKEEHHRQPKLKYEEGPQPRRIAEGKERRHTSRFRSPTAILRRYSMGRVSPYASSSHRALAGTNNVTPQPEVTRLDMPPSMNDDSVAASITALLCGNLSDLHDLEASDHEIGTVCKTKRGTGYNDIIGHTNPLLTSTFTHEPPAIYFTRGDATEPAGNGTPVGQTLPF